MLSQLAALAVIVLIATLSSANAVVTNLCSYDVYIWSVPGDMHQNIITPGGSYVEAFHHGESNSGIALKISSESDGIYSGGDELIFAYSVDPHDGSKVWLNVDSLRGDPFDGDYCLVGCFGALGGDDNPTKDCPVDEDAKLVLCASEGIANIEHFGKPSAGQKVDDDSGDDDSSDDESGW